MAKRREPDHVPPMLQDSYASIEFEDKICPVVAAAKRTGEQISLKIVGHVIAIDDIGGGSQARIKIDAILTEDMNRVWPHQFETENERFRKGQCLLQTVITDTIYVSTGLVPSSGPGGPFWYVETWVFSKDDRLASMQAVHACPTGNKIETCMFHVGRALTAHKKIAEKIRKIVDEEFVKENGDTSYDLEEFDDLGPEKVAPVLL